MASIVWPGSVNASDDLDTGWRNDTSHADGTEDGSDVAEGFHAVTHNEIALLLNAMRGEMGANPSGSFADVAARLNGRLTARKTADQTFTSTTLANVTDLVLPVDTAGIDYRYIFELWWITNTAGVVAQFDVTTPSVGVTGNASQFWESADMTTPTTVGTDMVATQVLTGSAALHNSVGGTSIPATNIVAFTRLTGRLQNPTATGSIQVRCKIESAGATITVLRACWGELCIS